MMEILEDPKRIFNCDESAFYLSPKDKQVLVRRGSKKVYCRVANDEKECLTVLVTIGADGSTPPPLVLFPYKRYIPSAIISQMPSQWGVGHSESGWMTSEIFFEYIINLFFPWLKNNSIVLPVVLFLDGHSSQINISISEFCKENGIILQPLDVGVFYPLKNCWRNDVNSWRLENNSKKLQRSEFPKLLQKSLERTITSSIVDNAFRSCGLYP